MYRKITYETRVLIENFIKDEMSITNISKELGLCKSAISRELRRNNSDKRRKYTASCAHKRALERAKNKGRKSKLTPEIKVVLRDKIVTLQWSPQQVSGWLKINYNILISHESIYKYIYSCPERKEFIDNLRRGHRSRRKRKNKTDLRGQIPQRTPIKNRPEIVNQQLRIGDFEADTIVGKNHQGSIVTLVDRKSLYVIMLPLKDRKSESLTQSVIKHFRNNQHPIHTLTADNGKEFAKHQQIQKELNIDIYFADPYSAWQRGCNENLNGLIRQYLPKSTDFSNLNNQQIRKIQEKLNNRPRKKLGFLTPNDVYLQKCCI